MKKRALVLGTPVQRRTRVSAILGLPVTGFLLTGRILPDLWPKQSQRARRHQHHMMTVITDHLAHRNHGALSRAWVE